MISNFNIEVYKEFNDELEKLWINFEKESNHYYFQTFKWQKYWFKQMRKNKKNFISMYIIVVKNNNEILFILPMCINKFFCFKILSWSGFPFSDYNAPLIKKDFTIKNEDFLIVWKLILKKNKKSFNGVNLVNQPKTINHILNPFFQFLKSSLSMSYFGIFFEENHNKNKSLILDLKYQTNRLKKVGDLVFNIAKCKKEKKIVLKFILENKRAQYKKTDGWDLFEINAYKLFFIECHINLYSNLHLSYLTLNDNIIAAHSGYIYNNHYYYLFPAYDFNFKKYSPGKILLNYLIVNCKEKKISYFDFTIGAEEYKKKWSNHEINSCHTLRSVNMIGFFYVTFIKFKIILRNMNFKNKLLSKIKNKINTNVK